MEEIESLKKEIKILKDAIERYDYAMKLEHDCVSSFNSAGFFYYRTNENDEYNIEKNNKEYFIECYKNIIKHDGSESLDYYIKNNRYEEIKNYIDKIPLLKKENVKRGLYLHNKYKDIVILDIMKNNNDFYDNRLIELQNIKQIPKKNYWFFNDFI